MKNTIKLATVFATMATTSMLAVTALPASMVLADTVQTSTTSVSQNTLNSQERLLQNNIKAVAHTEVEGGTTTVTVTDSDLVTAMKDAGYSIQPNLTRANGVTKNLTRANGVTKIVWHGSSAKGNVDFYLSKTWLNNIAAAGVGAAAGALGALLPGAGWSAAIGAISGVIANQTFSSGKVFKIRSFTYVGHSNQ